MNRTPTVDSRPRLQLWRPYGTSMNCESRAASLSCAMRPESTSRLNLRGAPSDNIGLAPARGAIATRPEKRESALV
jgi:hypothetical protein